MARISIIVAMSVLMAANAANTRGSLRSVDQTESFVRALEFKHGLRVCNAYPFAASLDLYRNTKERLTGDTPMPYKACRDFQSQLKAGDKLDFKVGDSSAGTFSVGELPSNNAVLFLVIHRHDTLSTAVAFESHVFANLLNAQVAVIDTYKGSAQATPQLMSVPAPKEKSYSEELRFDSVVAVNPGRYEVILDGRNGTNATSHLVALPHESYVILRTGVEAQRGPSYPQELVIYPRSDARLLNSDASAKGPMFLLAMPTMLMALIR